MIALCVTSIFALIISGTFGQDGVTPSGCGGLMVGEECRSYTSRSILQSNLPSYGVPAPAPGYPLPGQKWRALVGLDGTTTFFKGGQCWRFWGSDLLPGYPKNQSTEWPGVPLDFDVIMRWADQNTYFFRGNEFWRWDDFKQHVDAGFPKSLEMHWIDGLPADMDAAFTSPNRSLTYIFKGSHFWKADEHWAYGGIDTKPTSINSSWTGPQYTVPNNLDAAFLYYPDLAFFIKGEHYFAYNFTSRSVTSHGDLSERFKFGKRPAAAPSGKSAGQSPSPAPEVAASSTTVGEALTAVTELKPYVSSWSCVLSGKRCDSYARAFVPKVCVGSYLTAVDCNSTQCNKTVLHLPPQALVSLLETLVTPAVHLILLRIQDANGAVNQSIYEEAVSIMQSAAARLSQHVADWPIGWNVSVASPLYSTISNSLQTFPQSTDLFFSMRDWHLLPSVVQSNSSSLFPLLSHLAGSWPLEFRIAERLSWLLLDVAEGGVTDCLHEPGSLAPMPSPVPAPSIAAGRRLLTSVQECENNILRRNTEWAEYFKYDCGVVSNGINTAANLIKIGKVAAGFTLRGTMALHPFFFGSLVATELVVLMTEALSKAPDGTVPDFWREKAGNANEYLQHYSLLSSMQQDALETVDKERGSNINLSRDQKYNIAEDVLKRGRKKAIDSYLVTEGIKMGCNILGEFGKFIKTISDQCGRSNCESIRCRLASSCDLQWEHYADWDDYYNKLRSRGDDSTARTESEGQQPTIVDQGLQPLGSDKIKAQPPGVEQGSAPPLGIGNELQLALPPKYESAMAQPPGAKNGGSQPSVNSGQESQSCTCP